MERNKQSWRPKAPCITEFQGLILLIVCILVKRWWNSSRKKYRCSGFKKSSRFSKFPKSARKEKDAPVTSEEVFRPVYHRGTYSSNIKPPARVIVEKKLDTNLPLKEGNPDGKQVVDLVRFFETIAEEDRRSMKTVPVDHTGWSYQANPKGYMIFWPSDGYCLFKSVAAYYAMLGIRCPIDQWYYSADMAGSYQIVSRLPKRKDLRIVMTLTDARSGLYHVGLEVLVKYKPKEEEKEQENGEEQSENRRLEAKSEKLGKKIAKKRDQLDVLARQLESSKKMMAQDQSSEDFMSHGIKLTEVKITHALLTKRRCLINRFRTAVKYLEECEHCTQPSRLLQATSMLNTMGRGLVNQSLIEYVEKLVDICPGCAEHSCGPIIFDDQLYRKLEHFGIVETKVKNVRSVKTKVAGWADKTSKKLQAQGIIGTWFQKCRKLQGHATNVTDGKPSEYFMQVANDSEHAGSRTLANLYQSEMFSTTEKTLYVDVQSKTINSLETISNLFTYVNSEGKRVRNKVPAGASYLCYRQNVTIADSQYMQHNTTSANRRCTELTDHGIDVIVSHNCVRPARSEKAKTEGEFDITHFRQTLSDLLRQREIEKVVFCFSDMHWYIDWARWNTLMDAIESVHNVSTSIVAVGMDFPRQNGFYFIGDEEGVAEVYNGSVVFYARGNGDPYMHPNLDPGMPMLDATLMTPLGNSTSINYGRWAGRRFNAKVKYSDSSNPRFPQIVNFYQRDLHVKEKLALHQLRVDVSQNISYRLVKAALNLEMMERAEYVSIPLFLRISFTYLAFCLVQPATFWEPKVSFNDMNMLRDLIRFQGFKGPIAKFLDGIRGPLALSLPTILLCVVAACTVPNAITFLLWAILIREINVFIILTLVLYQSDNQAFELEVVPNTLDILEENGTMNIFFSEKKIVAGAGQYKGNFFVRKPIEEVSLINRDNRTLISAQFYVKQARVSEEEHLKAAEAADNENTSGPRPPLQTGFDFETPKGEVRSYAYDHTSIVNLQHAISNRIFRPNTGVHEDWLRRLDRTTDREFAELIPKIDQKFVEENWKSPEDLIESKQGFGEKKKEVYREAVRKQRDSISGTTFYSGFVKAYETYSNPKDIRGRIIYGDKKRARIVENRPQIAAGIPWIVANWMNATLGKLVPEYSYKASEKTLSEFLCKMKKENKRHTLSTDFGAMDSTVYHETQELVERKLLRKLTPIITQRLTEHGFPREMIDAALKWMTATVKTTKFFTKIGKIIVKRKGGRASGDPSTTWANTLTTIMFAKTCMRKVGKTFSAKVSGDDLTIFSSDRNALQALRDEILESSSRTPESDEFHSGFVIATDECVLGYNRATFCSKTLHIEECAVIPNLTNFYFNSRLYTGSNINIIRNWKAHRYAVALSRLLAAGSSSILQEYALQLCQDLRCKGSSVKETYTKLTTVVKSNPIDYFKMFGDFWDEQEVHQSDQVDLLVAKEAKIEGINLDLMLEKPEGNVKYYLLAGFKNKNPKEKAMSSEKVEARNLMAHFFHPDGQPVRISAGGRKDIAVGSIKQHYTDESANGRKIFRFQMHDLSTLGYVMYPSTSWWNFNTTTKITTAVGPQNTEYLVTAYSICMEETAPATAMQGRFYVLHSNVGDLNAESIMQHPNVMPVSIRDTVIQTMVPDTPNDLLFVRSPTDSSVMERYIYVMADGVSQSSRIAVTVSAKYEFVIVNQYKGIASPAQKVGNSNLLSWISNAAGKFNTLSPDSKRSWMDNLSQMYSVGRSITYALNSAPRSAAPVMALMGAYNMDRTGVKPLRRGAPLGKAKSKKKKKSQRRKLLAGFKRVNVYNYDYVEGPGESHPKLLTIDRKTFVAVESIKPQDARDYYLSIAKQVYEAYEAPKPA